MLKAVGPVENTSCLVGDPYILIYRTDAESEDIPPQSHWREMLSHIEHCWWWSRRQWTKRWTPLFEAIYAENWDAPPVTVT